MPVSLIRRLSLHEMLQLLDGQHALDDKRQELRRMKNAELN